MLFYEYYKEFWFNSTFEIKLILTYINICIKSSLTDWT